jgi:hypothetical protein
MHAYNNVHTGYRIGKSKKILEKKAVDRLVKPGKT